MGQQRAEGIGKRDACQYPVNTIGKGTGCRRRAIVWSNIGGRRIKVCGPHRSI